MISLEGLTLVTGRHREAGNILRTFAHVHPRRPDPEHVPRRRARRALSHGRRHDVVLPRRASLRRSYTNDRETLRALLPKLIDIIDHHIDGHALRHPRRSGATACSRRAPRDIS